MREISPAKFADTGESMSTDEYLEWVKGQDHEKWQFESNFIANVRKGKGEGTRSSPSLTLIDNSTVLTEAKRKKLLDKVAELVDENAAGRSDMCRQFADLLQRSLVHLGHSGARIAVGTAVYYNAGGDLIFRWQDQDGEGAHDWVEIGDEVIDGNADSMTENPFVPGGVVVSPYWGPPKGAMDRKFIKNPGVRSRTPDDDVDKIWWPELKIWLDENMT